MSGSHFNSLRTRISNLDYVGLNPFLLNRFSGKFNPNERLRNDISSGNYVWYRCWELFAIKNTFNLFSFAGLAAKRQNCKLISIPFMSFFGIIEFVQFELNESMMFGFTNVTKDEKCRNGRYRFPVLDNKLKLWYKRRTWTFFNWFNLITASVSFIQANWGVKSHSDDKLKLEMIY